MKKSFTSGLDSLLGEPSPRTAPAKQDPPRAKRGRPAKQDKEITKTSQEGTKPYETRATFIVREDLLEDLKAIAYWERSLIKDVVNRALAAEVESYKKAHKGLQPIPRS
jgi:hypothetical protein